MKKIVLSMTTPAIELAAEPFIANHRRYAEARGYEYRCATDVHKDIAQLPASYSKVFQIVEALDEGYELVVWADADVAFTRLDIDAETLVGNGHDFAALRELGKGCQYVCCGFMIVRSCGWTKKMFADVKAQILSATGPTEHPWEQTHVNAWLCEAGFNRAHLCTEDEIGSFWEELLGQPTERPWQYGDFHIHCGAAAWPKRGSIFMTKYSNKVVTSPSDILRRNQLLKDGSIPEADSQLTKDDAGRVKLFIGVPTYGGVVSVDFCASMFRLEVALREAGVSTCIRMHNGEMVARARNKIVDEFLSTDCTHLMFIDSDIGFDAKDVIGMLAANLYVVGGVYPLKAYSWDKVAQLAASGTPSGELPTLAVDYCFNAVPSHYKYGQHQTNALRTAIEVSNVGTGFLMVKRECFAMWAERYPGYSYSDDYGPTRGKRIALFFDYGVHNDRYLSEDWWFCQLWRDMGGKVWAWPWAQLRHTGQHVFQGKFDRKCGLSNATETTAQEG